MNPLLVHLVTVHVPVVGLLFAACAAVGAAIWNDRRLLVLALGFAGFCVAAGIVAYASGPAAYEVLRQELDPATMAIADTHAVFGKISFAALVVIGIGLIQVVIRWAGGTRPPRWVGWVLAVVLFATTFLLSATAHLGGGIRHPEARSSQDVQKSR